jgi:hypothetical protein
MNNTWGRRTSTMGRLKSGSTLVDNYTKNLYLYSPPVATVVQYYINTSSTSGGDGTTNATTGASRAFVNWTDAKTAIYAAYPNFVAANVQVNIDVTGLVSNTVNATGFVGDDTHFLQLRAASGQAHAGYYDVTKAGFTASASAQTIYPVANYVRFDRLQIVNANSSVSFGNGLQEDATNILGVIISNCVIHRTGRSAGTVTGGDAYSYGGIFLNKLTLVNNVISGSWFGGITKSYIADGSQLVIYNNTVIGTTSIGIALNGNIPTGTGFLKNNRVEGGSACYALGSSVLTTATNFSSDTTSPDTAGRSKTGTYVNSSTFNYTPVTGDVGIDTGTTLTNDTTYKVVSDIIGTTYPTESGWNVGAFEYVSTLTSYTLVADVKAIIITKYVTGLLYNRILVADTKAISITKNPANLLQNKTLVADIKAISITEYDVNLVYNRVLTADTKAINITKNLTNLLFNHTLVANVKDISITAYAANLLYNHTLVATTKSIVITKIDATLTYSGTPIQYTLTATVKNIVITKNPANLLINRTLIADVKSVVITKNSTNLILTRTLVADTKAIGITTYNTTYKISARISSVTVNGLTVSVFAVPARNPTTQAVPVNGLTVTTSAGITANTLAGVVVVNGLVPRLPGVLTVASKVRWYFKRIFR